jgi:pyruvate dehydrogenase E1 component alpha subunit
VGLGLALKTKGIKQAACVFFGDGATEEGVFYESVNIAAIRKLPVLFLCENNQYSVYTPLEERQAPGRKIVNVAQSLGIRAVSVDGHSAIASLEALGEILPSVRAGDGPMLIEFHTHRYREHCGPNDDDHLNYRKPGELEAWQSRDPVAALEALLGSQNGFSTAIRAEIRTEIAEAFAFAKASAFPDPSGLSNLVFA